jgi:hypothetical protein
MTGWIVENGVVLAGVFLLLLVGSLPAPQQRLKHLAVPLLLAALVAGAALFKLGQARSHFVPNSGVSTTLKYAIEQVQAAKEPNLLFIEGGSYVQKGVDAKLLERQLNRLGYAVRVVRLALVAANHFERYQLQRDLINELGATPHAGQRWIMLAEAHLGYDTQPLAQFHGNRDTARALHYLTPSNAFYAFRAQSDPSMDPPYEGGWRWDVLRHTLINGFNVGVTDRLMPLDAVVAERGIIPNSRERYRGAFDLTPLGDEIRHPTPDRKPPPWLKRIRERRVLELWGNRLDELVYFAVPSTQVEQLKHARAFCGSTRRKCIAPLDQDLLDRLSSRKLWLDVGHLNRKGAREYTLWLAAHLAAQSIFVK